jgi:hypothetical protein
MMNCFSKWGERFGVSVIALLLLYLLSGCWPSAYGDPEPEYLTLIEASPCWQGICPGETTKAEVRRILPEIDFGMPGEIYEVDSSNSIELWFDKDRFDGSSAGVYFDETGTVESIVIDQLRRNLTIGQIVDFLGEPAWTIASTGCGDATFAGFTLWYPELGLEVVTNSFQVDQHPKASEMVLDRRLAVFRLTYKGADASEERQFESFGSQPTDTVRNHLYSWPGFDTTLPSYMDGCR